MDTKRATKGTVKTGTLTSVDVRERTLTREEELVVRMLRGLGEGPDYPLEFRGRLNPELNARLALIEAVLLAEEHGIGPLAVEAEAVDRAVKDRILDKLGKL